MRTELEELLGELVTAGVLVEHEDGEQLKPSPRFGRERETQRSKLEETEEHNEYSSSLNGNIEDLDETIIADALAIQEIAPNIEDRMALRAADALSRFSDETFVKGVPEGFVPVRANEVTTFVEQHEGAVVYFWGDDCEPCDRMREEFEALIEQDAIPDELGLGAVYLGSEADISSETVDLIAEEWQVTIVPTTLFFLNGETDSRYYGWKHKAAIRREIELLIGYVRGEDMPINEADGSDLDSKKDEKFGEKEGDDERTVPVDVGKDAKQPESEEQE